MKMNDAQEDRWDATPAVTGISAITLATKDMATSVRFYKTLGFELRFGGEEGAFSSFCIGQNHLNLVSQTGADMNWWGRIVFHVTDVDLFHDLVLANGYRTLSAPRDAEWGERYFHMRDPDGHELSFAKPL